MKPLFTAPLLLLLAFGPSSPRAAGQCCWATPLSENPQTGAVYSCPQSYYLSPGQCLRIRFWYPVDAESPYHQFLMKPIEGQPTLLTTDFASSHPQYYDGLHRVEAYIHAVAPGSRPYSDVILQTHLGTHRYRIYVSRRAAERKVSERGGPTPYRCECQQPTGCRGCPTPRRRKCCRRRCGC